MSRHELLEQSRRWLDAVVTNYGILFEPHHSPADQVERVHQFRVAIRRVRSVLPALASGLGGGARKKASLVLRNAATATGDTRDEEVLAETLDNLALRGPVTEHLAHWRKGRERRLVGTRKLAIKRLADEFDVPLRKTLATLRHGLLEIEHTITEAPSVAALLTAKLNDLESRTRRALEQGGSEDFHRARIGAKKLRYLAEWLDGSVATNLNEVADVAAKLQKTLGKLHDLEEAAVRMERARGLSNDDRKLILIELERRRKKAEQRSRADLVKLLPELAHELERCTAELNRSVGALEERGDALADADAQGRHATFSAGSHHAVNEGGDDASARTTDRVAESDRPA